MNAFERQQERKQRRALERKLQPTKERAMLNAKEIAELKRLQAKAGQQAEPLTERELAIMETRVAEVAGGYDRRMQEIFIQPWTAVQAQIQVLANDNARLIAEVRRLQQPIPVSEDPNDCNPASEA